jgi:hypothetical protein
MGGGVTVTREPAMVRFFVGGAVALVLNVSPGLP